MKQCTNPECNSVLNLTKHHLIPRRFRYVNASRGAVVENREKKILLCFDCHTLLHKLKTNKQLAENYNTTEKVVELLANKFKEKQEYELEQEEYNNR